MPTNLSRHQPAPQRFPVMGMYLTVEEFYRLKAATNEFLDHMNAYMRVLEELEAGSKTGAEVISGGEN